MTLFEREVNIFLSKGILCVQVLSKLSRTSTYRHKHLLVMSPNFDCINHVTN